MIVGSTSCGFAIPDGFEVHSYSGTDGWKDGFEDKVKAVHSAATFEYNDSACTDAAGHSNTVTITNGADKFRYQIAIFKKNSSPF